RAGGPGVPLGALPGGRRAGLRGSPSPVDHGTAGLRFLAYALAREGRPPGRSGPCERSLSSHSITLHDSGSASLPPSPGSARLLPSPGSARLDWRNVGLVRVALTCRF